MVQVIGMGERRQALAFVLEVTYQQALVAELLLNQGRHYKKAMSSEPQQKYIQSWHNIKNLIW